MALKHGMSAPLKKAWPRIGRVINKTLGELGEHPANLTAIKPTPKSAYGSGVWGYVFPTGNPRWVLKVTADPTEGPITAAVMEHDNLRYDAGVCYFAAIWRLGVPVGVEGEYEAYIILREDMTPVLQKDKDWVTFSTQVDRLNAIQKSTGAYNEQMNAVEDAGSASAMDKHIAALEKLAPRLDREYTQALHTKYLRAVVEFQIEFFETFGRPLADIHFGNIGWRVHNLDNLGVDLGITEGVNSGIMGAYDLGNSEIESEAQIPRLPRRNPEDIPTIWEV